MLDRIPHGFLSDLAVGESKAVVVSDRYGADRWHQLCHNHNKRTGQTVKASIDSNKQRGPFEQRNHTAPRMVRLTRHY